MGAVPLMRFFRLSEGGVQCGEDGLFVGSTPLLLRSSRPSGGDSWVVRPSDELERDLGASYGLPIDVAAKHGGLTGVARALERGDLALAKIAAVLLQFPDPPSLAKGAPPRGSVELAAQLFESGLLKEWDESKHPRLGGPPNRGRFAVNPDKGELAVPGGSQRKWPVLPELWREAKRALRGALKETAADVAGFGRAALWADPRIKVAVEAALEIMSSSELNRGEQQAIDQVRASVDPPKALQELYEDPTQNVLGYERHHIVEQNPDNVAKSPIEIAIEKFGWDVIDDPSNIVWVPRLKHELITGYYNSKVAGDSQGRLYRQVVNAMDYHSQYEAGLAALRMFGVLQ
ncbi:MAG: AHH domain-containing protein [Roseiarcus sp.]